MRLPLDGERPAGDSTLRAAPSRRVSVATQMLVAKPEQVVEATRACAAEFRLGGRRSARSNREPGGSTLPHNSQDFDLGHSRPGSEEVPSVPGEIEKYSDGPVALLAWFDNELDPSIAHAVI